MFSAIGFAIKMVLAVALVLPLLWVRREPSSERKVTLYALLSIISTSVMVLSRELDAGVIAGLYLVGLSVLSAFQFRDSVDWHAALESVAPVWIVAAIGMCVGAGLILQSILLVGAIVFVLTYLPRLTGHLLGRAEPEKAQASPVLDGGDPQ